MSRALLLVLLSLLLVLQGCSARASASGASDARGYGGGMPQADTATVSEEADMGSDSAEAPPAPPMPAAPEPSPVAARMSTGSTSGGAPAAQAPPMMRPAPAKMKSDEGRELEKKAAELPPGGGQSAQPSMGKPSSGPKPAVASQMLVYTAQLHLQVREVSKAINAVEKLAKDRGGYLVLREDNRITVRVPSARFDATLDEIAGFGDLVHRNVTIEDVTDLYFDMQIRMKNLEVVKKRLEELLEKAKTVEESLAVQRQIERVTIELERMRGKLKLLAELVMFSTITVVLEPKSSEQLESQVRLPFPWMDRLGLGELLRL